MTNRHGLPVLEAPKPVPRAVEQHETSVALVLNFCAGGCKRLGYFRLQERGWCECCFPAELVRSAR